MQVTADRTPLVAFTLSAAETTPDDAGAEAVAGATKALALFCEERKRFARREALDHLKAQKHGRPTCEAALKNLADLGVLYGPLKPEEKHGGERGHWYVFVKPLPARPGPETGEDGADEDPDDL
jgi:hypothetical protein